MDFSRAGGREREREGGVDRRGEGGKTKREAKILSLNCCFLLFIFLSSGFFVEIHCKLSH